MLNVVIPIQSCIIQNEILININIKCKESKVEVELGFNSLKISTNIYWQSCNNSLKEDLQQY